MLKIVSSKSLTISKNGIIECEHVNYLLSEALRLDYLISPSSSLQLGWIADHLTKRSERKKR